MNQSIQKQLATLLLVACTAIATKAQTNTALMTKRDYKLTAVAEIGFLGVLAHKIQFGNKGTYFDYQKDGGQDVLFPIIRPSLELQYKKRNTFILLYQPLTIETKVLLDNDLVVDELTYPANSGVRMLYNFPFYRASYMRNLTPISTKLSFDLGGTIQIRNATISFESLDGTRGAIANILIENGIEEVALTDEQSKVTTPSLLLWGKYDIIVPPQLGYDALNKINTNDKKPVVFDQSAHSPMNAEWELFNAEIDAFIQAYK